MEPNLASENEESDIDVEMESTQGSDSEKESGASSPRRKKRRIDPDADASFADESSDNDSTDEVSASSGWADAMLKLLSAPVKAKNFILSKAKKDGEIVAKKVKEVEMVDESGQVVQAKTVEPVEKSKSYIHRRKEMLEKKKQKAEWEAMCRVKPSVIKKEKERELVKVATRGVVHLFNTVEKHQKTLKSTKKESRREKPNVMKGKFMDILKECSMKDKVNDDPQVKRVKEEETWSILKDDFMMGAEMKDWDKESDVDT